MTWISDYWGINPSCFFYCFYLLFLVIFGDGFLMGIGVGNCRWGMWVWKLVRPRVWDQHSSAKHRPLQQWAELWGMLRDEMQRRPKMVSLRDHHRHRHKFLPTKLGLVKLQWRLVQSSTTALRSCWACLPPDCPIPSWNRPCFFQEVNPFFFLLRIKRSNWDPLLLAVTMIFETLIRWVKMWWTRKNPFNNPNMC